MDVVVYDKVGKEAEKVRSALYGIYPQETITDAAIASFADGTDGIPVEKLIVNIEPAQAGSGDPSPDNIRPISGWTGANVTRAGANLFDETANPGKWIDATGAIVTSTATSAVSDKIYVNSGITTAKIVCDYAYATLLIAAYDSEDTLLLRNARTEVTALTMTIPEDAAYIRFAKYSVPSACCGYLNSEDIIREEFNGFSTIPVTFPAEAGTVYGGTLTINPDRTGTLTVDTRHTTIVYSESQSSPTTDVTFGLGARAKGFALSDNGLKCNRFQPSNYTTAKGFYVFTPNEALIRFTSPDPIADWRAYFQANPTEITYKLATPSVFPLTAEQVSGILTTLYGTNNIWADTGNIKKLTYRADLGKYIDSHITTAVANALNA